LCDVGRVAIKDFFKLLSFYIYKVSIKTKVHRKWNAPMIFKKNLHITA